MSPYCSAHDEWLIMKMCMYVGYHDANNVANFGGDPMTQLNLKKGYSIICFSPKTCRHIIIIMAEMAVFYVAGYLIEERRRWPVITASPRGQCSK